MPTYTFPGRYDSLEQIAAVVRQAAQDAGLDSQAVYAVETAVDEACSNIIEHAYGAEGLGDIECTLELDEKGLIIILLDHGQPFDPTHVKKPNPKRPLAERETGGWGLYIMQQWMDEVSFHFEDGANILIMHKHRRETK
ncbi:MAG TPA: ATP-binding protein [Anaerolineaceae bacterium]|nr:ATP-binding protein [Anaerolineaceae bacterium]